MLNEYNDIINTLSGVGFRKNEIIIYINLLLNPNSSALQLAKQTSLHRSNVYDVIRLLMSKGIIEECMKDEKKSYLAKSPSIFLEYINQKQEQVKKIVPLLESLKTKKNIDDEESSSISFGKLGFKHAVYKILSQKKDIAIFNAPTDISKYMSESTYRDFYQISEKNKIKIRIIFGNQISTPITKIRKSHVELKIAKKSLNDDFSPSPCLICGNLINFMVIKDPLTLFEIKSEIIAKNLMNNFEQSWQIAEKLY